MPRLFTPAAFTFLRALKRNNRREWFEAHRPEYERDLLAPLRALAEEFDVRFATLAPEFVGDPKRSLFRIYRDVRFSKDKTPYKTHAAMWIYHRAPGRGVGKEIDGGAGFYFHVEPGASLVAGGLWMPPRPSLAKVRAHLDEDLAGWQAAVGSPAMRKRFGGLTDDEPGVKLKRLPRGYDEGHPAGDWLRNNSFTVSRPYTDAEVLSPKVVDAAMKDFAAMLPMVRWLNRALGYLPSKSR
ncbi:MAG: DUF2461 domain-containing protein [Gemmatimonadetes bacterium]|nr:DUF2461 domain-containing protein [Gemmatimonadota bacterium]